MKRAGKMYPFRFSSLDGRLVPAGRFWIPRLCPSSAWFRNVVGQVADRHACGRLFAVAAWILGCINQYGRVASLGRGVLLGFEGGWHGGERCFLGFVWMDDMSDAERPVMFMLLFIFFCLPFQLAQRVLLDTIKL